MYIKYQAFTFCLLRAQKTMWQGQRNLDKPFSVKYVNFIQKHNKLQVTPSVIWNGTANTEVCFLHKNNIKWEVKTHKNDIILAYLPMAVAFFGGGREH